MKYVNNLSEPNGQVQRQVSIHIEPDVMPAFQPCIITIAVLNVPDPPVIILPDE